MSDYSDAYNTVLGGVQYVQQQGDLGTQRRKQNALAQLTSQYAGGQAPDQGFYNQVADNGGDPLAFRNDAQSQQEKLHKQVAAAAVYLHGLPPESRAKAYPGIVPLVRAAFPGVPVPDQYDASVEDALNQIMTATAGAAQTMPGGQVQSTFIDAQGNRVGIMRDGSTQVLGQNAPNTQLVEGPGGYYGVDKRNFQAAPVTLGGTPQAAPAPVVGSGIVLDDETLKQLMSVPANERATMLAGMQGGGQVFHPGPDGQPIAGPSAGLSTPPKQLQSAPKIAAPQTTSTPLSAKEVAALGLPAGSVAQRDSNGKVDIISKPDPATRLSQTQLRQANTAKAKLIDLQSVKNQLAKVQQMFGPIQNTMSAGPFGQGKLPTEDGRRYDAAVALLQQQVRKLTRTPGEGSMSDWEGRLALLANPDRNDYESVTQDKIDQLNALVNQIEAGYTALRDDNAPGQTPQTNAPIDAKRKALLDKY
jgi:hypothetical protein